MIYVEAVKDFDVPAGSVSVFLAGGISGCPDFQAEMCGKMKDLDDRLVVFNPRRKNFPIDDPSAAKEQIKWEFDMLRKADIISFWFPKETLCPIVLYELGAHSMTKKPLVIGAHSEYQRRQDVVIQTSLVRPNIPVFDTLDEVVERIRYWYKVW